MKVGKTTVNHFLNPQQGQLTEKGIAGCDKLRSTRPPASGYIASGHKYKISPTRSWLVRKTRLRGLVETDIVKFIIEVLQARFSSLERGGSRLVPDLGYMSCTIDCMGTCIVLTKCLSSSSPYACCVSLAVASASFTGPLLRLLILVQGNQPESRP
ncbi:hypothetical protein J6590_018471 [Homalodisca vitripennis]|nr:hypothetical protein J6590_018471 [Homalodisca vitripennis]